MALDFNLSRDDCDAEQKVSMDVECVRQGLVNAIVFWHELQLDGELTLSAGPESSARQGIVMSDRDLVVSDGLGQLSITVRAPIAFLSFFSLSCFVPVSSSSRI